MNRIMLGRLRLTAICLGLAVAAMSPTSVWALGLGEIELTSALNERLDAEIELLDASGLQPAEIFISLGSPEDFEKVGVERFFFLTDLRFEVAYGDGGGAVVKVTSGQPITEPYLNFMIEVLWPKGRLLKEYTVLLDPPTFGEAAAAPVVRPTQQRAPSQTAGRVQRESSVSGTQVQLTPTQTPADSPLDDGVVDGEYRMTDRNDTLWKIAAGTLPSDAITVQQNMLAIQRLNPKAFISGNINLLKAGYVLRLPNEREALALNNSDATREVAQQNDAWRAIGRGETPTTQPSPQVAATQGADRGQVDATSSPKPTTAPVDSADGELRIVAGAGDSAAGQGTADVGELNASLEEQDRLSREVDELTYQLDREKELAVQQQELQARQLDVKNQEIAQLQNQVREMQQQMRDLEAQGPNQSAAPAGAAVAWWQSPYVLYGGVGALVLLLAAYLMFARRKQADEPVYESEGAFAEADDEGRLEPALALDAEELADDYEEEAELPVDEQVLEEDDHEPALQKSETGDVIGEADIYIAYGRYPQAIGLLLGILEDEPERNDVRMKLLEVYADVKDQEGFDTQMGALLEHCDEEDALLAARELESKLNDDELEVPDMDAAAEEQLVPDASTEGTVDDFSLELDESPEDDDRTVEVEAVLPEDDQTGATPGAAAALAAGDADAASESALDFELELDDLEDLAKAEGAGDELGGDLGLDFDPEKDVADELRDDPAEADTVEEALSLDDDQRPGEAEAGVDSADNADISDNSDNSDSESLEDLEFESEVATADDDEFDFQDEGDSASTKLDLARAYIDMGDEDGARDILKEVMDEGNNEQQKQAEELLHTL